LETSRDAANLLISLLMKIYGGKKYLRFGVRGKSLYFNQNLFLARAFNSRDEGDSII